MRKCRWWLVAMVAVVMACVGTVQVHAADDGSKTGATRFLAYEGPQKWPAGTAAEANKSYAVPIYEGLPRQSFKVIGRIVDDREGIEVVGKELDGFFGGPKKRLRNCANQAKQQGGDAVVITDHPDVLAAFQLSRKDAGEESPLAKDRKRVVLVVRF